MTTLTSSTSLAARSCASPFGPLTIVGSPLGLRAVLWPDDRPARAGLADVPSDGGTVGVLDETAVQLDEYFAGRPDQLRSPARSPGNGVPACCLAGPRRDPLRRDTQLRRPGNSDRPPLGRPGGRHGERPQSGLDRAPLPPRRRERRRPARVRGRARGQGGAPRSRAATRRHFVAQSHKVRTATSPLRLSLAVARERERPHRG